MKPTRWTGREPRKTDRKSPEDLQVLFDFANTELGPAADENLADLRNQLLSGPLMPLGVEDKQAAELLPEIQSHLRERFRLIMAKAESFWEEELLSIDFRGTLRVGVVPRGAAGREPHATDRFFESFTPSLNQGKGALENAKTLIDLWLAELIQDLGLQPSRFSRCAKCGKVFYQPTSRKKNYCSKQCAGAVRQARYEKRKRRQQG